MRKDIVYPAVDEPATPAYVLAVLRDRHRQQCRHDPEADPDAVLTPESTVSEWRAACDLVGWRQLGRNLNEGWGFAGTDAEWREALEPADGKRLAGVCRLIADRATRPRVRPARLFGATCVQAGAFLTIRSLLHTAGAPATEIAPSTPLAPYARHYAGVFLGPVSRLAPGVLPPVRIRTPVYHGAAGGLVAALFLMLVGEWGGRPMLIIAGVALFASSYALLWYAARHLLPAGVEFGELRTFRDLAVAVAAGNGDD